MAKLHLKASVSKEGTRLVAVASDATVDREGDSINPRGWNIANFLKNPVLQWAHNPYEPAIGKAENVRVEFVNGREALVFEPVFHEFTELASALKRMFEEGILNSFSVGFLPEEYDPSTGVIGSQELLEISAVNVPANPSARVIGAKAFGLSDEVIDKIANPDRYKSIIPYKKTPIAEKTENWDQASETEMAEIDDLKIMSTWVDSEKSDSKASYKLPHHKAGGSHEVVWRGVLAAMGALLTNNANIPESDRRGVYNHLAKHYEEFGEEAPAFRSYSAVEFDKMFGDAMEKVGRVLSKRTRGAVENVITLLQELLDSDARADSDEAKSGKPEIEKVEHDLPKNPGDKEAQRLVKAIKVISKKLEIKLKNG